MHALVAACPPLDRNSLYCNLLQCTHFAATSVVAERGGELVGVVSGYLLPDRSNTHFVWQVAVAPSARGEGLAARMLRELLERPACADVRYLETTITPTNRSSWLLFESLARSLRAPLVNYPLFDRHLHLDGTHETEVGVRIGPFVRARQSAPDRRTA